MRCSLVPIPLAPVPLAPIPLVPSPYFLVYLFSSNTRIVPNQNAFSKFLIREGMNVKNGSSATRRSKVKSPVTELE